MLLYLFTTQLKALCCKGMKAQGDAKVARSVRQSKILEIISLKEIETQDELVSSLRSAGFDVTQATISRDIRDLHLFKVTQATISRDIKELGLIKILSADTNKYKYAIVENGDQAVSNKYISIFKECVISIKHNTNFAIVRTIKGMASAICGLVDKLNLDGFMGAVCGDDTVLVIFPTSQDANTCCHVLSNMLVG